MQAEAAPERKKEVPEPEEVVYKTKVVEFLGRSTPIVLQNDNGPCPLLAICNVLLLRNNINLNLDASEVSLQKLLSLVAERLIDSNSNVEDKDEEYVNNQQQNIADAIDLLPRLATGIDVNVHFKKECAIFDLLDIGLYHGWIVDPQDADTAVAIGSKSYNTLVAEASLPLKQESTRGKEARASTEDISVSQTHPKTADNLIDIDMTMSSDPSATNADCNVSNGREESVDVSECVSSLEDSEPIYEGEECILDSQLSTFEDQEPVYEGEIILAEQSEKIDGTSSDHSKGEAAREQWQLIKTFLENNANQLTIYGLFCLQEGLKERELCVFFRNNHFNTMFKFNGELYILATDQGYLNQPDLVWEKLNEVNGDTVFVTGSFKKFNAESQVRDSWNEQNAMSSTADYLASLGASDPAGSTLNSDLQLAIALQQQEFEQQPQRQQQQQQQQPPPPQNPQQSVNVRSRLVTGPQVPRSSAASHKSESKSKDKCIIM
ncbi:hypothetical protein J5N97_025403 [Dioscorea zingiberensis]|uniref:MINDY deubiquitinase domain-containing protein n=1 Tax=Dioscorea zingiberensis TaxID=325984 RepID=A0A9D5C866_9LILI|nr:hypothetical protein J5N97_025403 [Dioscorea zingiberensis]